MPPPLRYRALRGLVRAPIRAFFRRVDVEGAEHVPTDRGGVLVAWHPNGLIDPALILAAFPRRVVFGAREGLLRWPVVGPIMRALGTVPIYRSVDQEALSPEARRAANRASLGALADAVAGGSFAALFPEGTSHDEPGLAPIRAGAARLALQAAEQTPPDARAPVVVPVGLHYEAKGTFRTRALVTFHPPLPIEGDADTLTARIEAALVEAVRPTESWALHALMHRARALIAAEAAARRGERPRDSMALRASGYAQIWHGYHVRTQTHPADIEALRRDTRGYHRQMELLDLADADLDRPPRLGSVVLVAGAVLQAIAVLLLLPPLLVIGYAVNLPPYWALKGLTALVAKAGSEAATVKIFGGVVFFPVAWVVFGTLVALRVAGLDAVAPGLVPVAAGVVGAVLAAVGGAAALVYGEVAIGAWRAVRVRVARWRHADRLAALRAMRADLHDRFVALADGLELPR
ncbi:1-acyl-sn-glycerol-3-phosphate acyltransferase [Rubrivirga sp. IMCC45206]|uniref:1-acyl-sn-glycerol-3-phosphate acyltransferase n=1 Tax=Rubrivirga sp. IMCC45206 TaxID=3391614 RepID=UPI00398FD013